MLRRLPFLAEFLVVEVFGLENNVGEDKEDASGGEQAEAAHIEVNAVLEGV